MSASKAAHALRQAGHDLPVALVMLKTGANAARRPTIVRASPAEMPRQALAIHPKRRAT